MLTDFHLSLGEHRPSVVFLEKKFNLSLGQYKLTGTIDRVDRLADGTHEIIDYKSGKKPKAFGYANKRQLLLYQAALEETFGLKVSKLTFQYLKDNEIVSFVAKPGELEKVKQDMLELIEEIRKGIFKRPPHNDCTYCSHGPVDQS